VDIFLKDLDHVRMGIIKHLAALLQALPPQRRPDYFETLWDIQSQTENWRWRASLAQQLDVLSNMFPPDVTHTVVRPLVRSRGSSSSVLLLIIVLFACISLPPFFFSSRSSPCATTTSRLCGWRPASAWGAC
jgi:hypothetical protein